jgi:putative hydrolase of the HAD superfamily
VKKIRLVLFDLGNVLVHFTPESFWQELRLGQNQRAPFAKGVKEAADRFECGKIKTGQFFDDLEQVFGRQFRREHIRRAVSSVLTDPIRDMEPLVARVTQRCKTALVSNTNEFHYRYCMDTVSALKMLPKHYLSYKLGVMKPDGSFYEKVLRDADIQPDAALFIDDVADNVEGARSVGMKVILFEGASSLEVALRQHGVL